VFKIASTIRWTSRIILYFPLVPHPNKELTLLVQKYPFMVSKQQYYFPFPILSSPCFCFEPKSPLYFPILHRTFLTNRCPPLSSPPPCPELVFHWTSTVGMTIVSCSSTYIVPFSPTISAFILTASLSRTRMPMDFDCWDDNCQLVNAGRHPRAFPSGILPQK
jgi:hypothetical protein